VRGLATDKRSGPTPIEHPIASSSSASRKAWDIAARFLALLAFVVAAGLLLQYAGPYIMPP
jgi:hypothetical protein